MDYLSYVNTVCKIKLLRINFILWDFTGIIYMHGSHLNTKTQERNKSKPCYQREPTTKVCTYFFKISNYSSLITIYIYNQVQDIPDVVHHVSPEVWLHHGFCNVLHLQGAVQAPLAYCENKYSYNKYVSAFHMNI